MVYEIKQLRLACSNLFPQHVILKFNKTCESVDETEMINDASSDLALMEGLGSYTQREETLTFLGSGGEGCT